MIQPLAPSKYQQARGRPPRAKPVQKGRVGMENVDPNAALQRLMVNPQLANQRTAPIPKAAKKAQKTRPSTAKTKQPASSYKKFIATQSQKAQQPSRRLQSATQRSNKDAKRKHSSKKRNGSKKSRSTQQMLQYQPLQQQQLNTISHLENA